MILICDYLGKWEVGSTTETGRMMTPVDVMRDLLRHGINKDHFMARAELDIGEDEIALLDTEDGVKQEVWAYLTSSISEPMAFVNKSSSSGFSRVLVFTVCGVQGVYDRYNLMFAFQCYNAEPEDVVERILQLTDNLRSRAPSAVSFPSNPSTFSPSSFATVHGKISAASSLRGSITSNREHYRKPIPFQVPKLPETRPESLGFDKPSFVYDHSDDQQQKDLILLNYCIDDIEAMCKDLRYARSSVGETDNGLSLEKLQEQYKATDFITVFQKFKLAFNLLGRLHPDMRDPTASELTHHLCPPLAFLVDACQNLFDEQVQTEVATPFLTEAAINLLKSSLSSREMLIWEACGDYWKFPKSQFEGSPVPFKPIFSDGWSPGYIMFEEDEPPKPSIRRNHSQNSAKKQAQAPPPVAAQVSDTESDYGSVDSGAGVPRYNDRGQEEYRDLLIKTGVAIALVTYSRAGANHKEMSVTKGEYLEIMNMDRKWWKVRNKSQEIGYVPFTILRMMIYRDPQDFLKEKAAALRQRSASPRPRSPSPDIYRSLSPTRGRYTEPRNHYKSPSPEKRRSQRDRSPSPRKSYRSPSPVNRRERSPSPRKSYRSPSPVNRRSQRQRSPSPRSRRHQRSPSPPSRHRRSSSSPRRRRSPSPVESIPPPPPPQPVFSETPTVLRKPSKRKERSNSVETSYSMAEELKHVLSYYKEEKQKKKLDILHTPDIFIDQRSTVREVQSWLKAKQFSSRVIKYLEGMNGRQVLGMHREALEAAFGKEEGSRLDSQITLSRNQTKYTLGKNSELRAILEKAKKRTEVKKNSSHEELGSSQV